MSLATLRELEVATVYVAGQRAGTLRRTHFGVQFQYDAAYEGTAVATTLPIRDEPYTGPQAGAVPPFFAGLLPEGRRLTALRLAAKTSADDDLTLLMAVGRDTIGNVTIASAERIPDEQFPVGALGDVRFAELFDRVVSESPQDRVGLPGVQPKVSGAIISFPVTYADHHWMLKLNPAEYPYLVENEHFFLTAAKSSGLDVPHHELVHDTDGVSGLLVRRFDRHPSGARFAQEDGCQVAQRYPADKYRLTSEEVITALASNCGAPVVAARELVWQTAFAYLTCNGDAHAKNFSIGRDVRGEWRVTPAYDLPSSHPYGDTTMALTINGKRQEDIGRKDFVAVGAAVSVPERAVQRLLDQLIMRSSKWLGDLERLPFNPQRVHRLRRAIEYRVKRLG
jgi:serine/threonine-protein kinase HipA